MSGKKFGGDKRKRDIMKSKNPRKEKRGGKKRGFKWYLDILEYK